MANAQDSGYADIIKQNIEIHRRLKKEGAKTNKSIQERNLPGYTQTKTNKIYIDEFK